MRKPAHRDAVLILALMLSAMAPLSAQTATLVKDINPRDEGAGSQPGFLHAMGDKVFFAAGEPSSGQELWVTDGTAVGTEMLADACPGDCSSNPFPLGHIGGILFWEISTRDGLRLWRSDGTRAGTFALTPEGSAITIGQFAGDLVYALSDHLLFFVGCTAEAGCELWASDGTVAGTRLVKDFTPGPAGSALGLQAVGGKVFVTRHDFANHQTVWVSDGTAAGTVLLKDLGVGQVDNVTAAGSHFFFLLTNATEGSEAWASDGTPAGTLQITHFANPSPFVEPLDLPALKASGQRVYFVADDSVHGFELWRSDGTSAGTVRLTEFDAAAPFRTDGGLSFVEEIGDLAVFIATDGKTVPKLWISRGSPASVTALPVPCGGACQFLPPYAFLIRAGSRVFFFAGDGAHGQELWTTDGTAAGTRMLRDICPGTCDGVDFDATISSAGTLLFMARDPVQGRQLWKSDGTPEGTRRITDFHGEGSGMRLDPESGNAVVSGRRIFFEATDSHEEELWVSENGKAPHLVADIGRAGATSFPASLVPYHGRLFFVASNGFARFDVWQSDGTSEGTLQVTSGPSTTSFAPADLTVAGDLLYFLTDPGVSSGQGLWRTDGTADGTMNLVADRFLTHLTAFKGSLYFFSADLSGDHAELWTSAGTLAGTVRVVTFPADGGTEDMQALGNTLYFVLSPFSHPQQLWKSDGTAAGTMKLADLPSRFNEALQLVPLGSRVFFLNVGSLWSTDGTPAGTVPVVGSDTAFATDLAEVGGALYLIARKFNGRELWRSDGSAAGTVRLGTFPGNGKEPSSSDHAQLTVAAGRLFFAADDGIHGTELWTSDGTAAGTALVRDVFPGLGSSHPSELRAAGGRLFFTAHDGTHGFELWQTDGTPAGTRLVQDIAPEEPSSTPDQLTVVGDRLFFTADDGIAGRELWSLPLTGPAGCQASPSQLCLNGGRYRVEAVWRDPQGNSGRGTGVPLTADTGAFWFFAPSNLEVVVKVLDGQGVNGHVWVFYGALSNVQYDLTVTDTQTGLTRRYSNLQGQLASIGDVHAFGPLGAYGSQPVISPPSPPPLIGERLDRAAAVPCQPTPQRLCLNGGRFAATVAWKDFQGHTGQGTAVPLTGDTGTFWFFNAANVELMVKALDGRPVNGHFWLFYGALSNVEYTLTVTDTQTGKVKTYTNPSGRFASVGDTQAF